MGVTSAGQQELRDHTAEVRAGATSHACMLLKSIGFPGVHPLSDQKVIVLVPHFLEGAYFTNEKGKKKTTTKKWLLI